MVKKIDKRDYLMRFFSLVIAIGLWLYVVYAENPELEFWMRGIKIEYSNQYKLEQNSLVVLTDIASQNVSVKIRGRRKNSGVMTAENVFARVNLDNITGPGTYYLPIDITFNVHGIEAVDKNPYNVSVVVDEVISMKKPVRVELAGNPGENFSIRDYSSSLGEIEVTGPSSVVSLITECVATMDVEGIAGKKTFTAPLRLMMGDGQEYSGDMLTLSNTHVNIVAEVLMTKSLVIVPVTQGGEELNIDVKATPETIEVFGSPDTLADVTEILTEVIELGEEQESGVIEVGIILPEGVSAQDSTVNVEIIVTEAPPPQP